MDKGDYKSFKGSSTTKKALIEFELRRLNPDMADAQIGLYIEDLTPIPENKISECFKLARLKNTRFKIPVSAQILEAWDRIKFKLSDWKITEDHASENLNKHAYYTIHNLPVVYMPQRWRYLLGRKLRKVITDEEAIELEEVSKIKVNWPDKKFNEKLQEKMMNLKNPDELVEIAEHKHLFKGIIKSI